MLCFWHIPYLYACPSLWANSFSKAQPFSSVLSTACCDASLFFFLCILQRILLPESYKKLCNASICPLRTQVFLGALTWVLAFPTAVFVEVISNMGIYSIFQVETYNQMAVVYLKMMATSPALLTAALITILLLAPLLEEFLFRGLFQSYLKRFFPRKTAILLSACCFALFHLAPSQGAGNIPLFFSLMTLGGFLGFLYEKTQSLIAPITLHIVFNTISALYILLRG